MNPSLQKKVRLKVLDFLSTQNKLSTVVRFRNAYSALRFFVAFSIPHPTSNTLFNAILFNTLHPGRGRTGDRRWVWDIGHRQSPHVQSSISYLLLGLGSLTPSDRRSTLLSQWNAKSFRLTCSAMIAMWSANSFRTMGKLLGPFSGRSC